MRTNHQRKRNRSIAFGLILLIVGCVYDMATAAPVFLGPSPYLSSADSPFSGETFSYFYLEDFETGSLHVPGISVTPGWSIGLPEALRDSVDADDGVIDGSGVAGHAFYSQGHSSLTIVFDAATLGNLPTHAGIVWTDVGFADPVNGFGNLIFAAVDAFGNALGSIGPFTLGDGKFSGQTAEDRFFGVINPDGISSITVTSTNSSDWEIDHIQYGYGTLRDPFTPSEVSEPHALLLMGVGGGILLCSAYRKLGGRGRNKRLYPDEKRPITSRQVSFNLAIKEHNER
jgi:hypothetical protein